MKKILSLLALLMTTVAAMAFDYTDVRSASEDGEPYYDVTDAKLTITPNDDGTYNVKFHNLEAKYGSTIDSFGTFEYRNLTGTTENGITTIQATGLTGYISLAEAGNPTNGTLYVKFTETKAYATLETDTQTYNATLSVKYGTDEGWTTGGGSTEEPVVEYPINFDKDATNTHGSRRTSSISLQQEGKALQTITFNNSRSGYEDHSAETFTVEAGSTVTPTFGYNGEWMHGYVYIDLDGNKQFDVNADDLANSPELVTYSYYKDLNSKGETVSGGVNVNPPSFTAPTTPGTYRIRYKIDWDNVDPGGNGTSSNNILSNGGGIWDATLVVEEAETPFEPTTSDYHADAYVNYESKYTNIEGGADVTITEYEKDKYRVTFQNITDGVTIYGNLTFNNLTATTTDDVTLYELTAESKAVWSNVTPAGVMSGITDNGEATFSDFSCVTDDLAENNKLELLFKVNVAESEFAFVFGQKYVPEVTVVTEKTFTDAISMVGDEFSTELGLATVTVKEMSDETINMTLSVTTSEGTTEYTASGFTKTVDADKNRTTYAGTLNLEGEDFNVNALVYTEAEAEKLYMVATGSYFNYVIGTNPDTPDTPDTPNVTKVVEDGYTPAGEKFSFPFSCDFNTQKLVWEVDFTNAGSQANQLVFTIGTSDADLSKWETPTGGNAHFYYTKQTTGGKIVLHYLHSGKREDVDNIAVDNVATFTLDAEGFHVGDQLAVTADQMPKLYEGGTDFLFGSQEGSGRSNAVYNYVEVRPLDATEVTEVSNKSYTSNLRIYDADAEEPVNVVEKSEAVVNIVKYSDDTYKVTLKDIAWGENAATDLVFVGSADAGIMSDKLDGEDATDQGVSIMAVPDDATAAVLGEGVQAMFQWLEKSEDALEMAFYLQIGTTTYAGEFNYEEETPELPEPTVYTDKAQTNYYGDFEYTDKVVNVYDLGENKYKVVYKEYNLGSSTTFDLVYNNVEGTTDEDGYTTYTFDGKATVENVTIAQGVIASVNEGDEVDATLNGKSKDGKLYATFTMSVMGGTATTVYGSEFTTPEEPVEEYAINFDKDATNNHASRRTTSVSLQQTDKDVQTLTFNSGLNGYEDHSADKEFSVEAGSEVATTFGYNGEWMHGYVYIDLDDNKQFDVNAEDLANSPELVAYSYYSGYNSKGETASSNVNVTPPTFTAPATPGTYRIRFKIDWDSVDPGGCVDSGNHILNNGGGIWDATLVVTEPVVDAINSINAEAAEGNAEIFTLNGSKVSKLQKGVNLVRTADGKVKKVLVK